MNPRYSRHAPLPGWSPQAQQRLAGARVALVGAGGLGCAALPWLVGAGVGHITLLDDDVVALHNLHRQPLYHTTDVGQPKASVAAQRMTALNPEVTVAPVLQRIVHENAHALLAGHTLVLDGSDNFGTRYLVNDVCVQLGLPLMQGSVYQMEGQVALWNYPARPLGAAPNLRCLYPQPPTAAESPSCSEGGVLGPVVAVVGGMMAQTALKLLSGVGQYLCGEVFCYDGFTGRSFTLQVSPDPANPLFTGQALAATDYLDETCAAVPQISPQALVLLLAEDPPLLVDVRNSDEREAYNPLGGMLIPLPALLAEPPPLPHDRRVVVYCARGGRSAQAAAHLAQMGMDVLNLAGGVEAWHAARLSTPAPVVHTL